MTTHDTDEPERLAVFAPSPIVTVTVEEAAGGPEIHFHPGGQGFWVARTAARLGASVVLCAPVGEESGLVLQALLEEGDIELRPVRCRRPNGVHVTIAALPNESRSPRFPVRASAVASRMSSSAWR